mgnify:CR=1 FL=1
MFLIYLSLAVVSYVVVEQILGIKKLSVRLERVKARKLNK